MDFPVDHLSASSITKFMRCPRLWQEEYVYKVRGASNSSLVIGSAVHLGLSRLLKGEDPGNYWQECVNEALEEGEIHWKDSPTHAENLARKHLYDYERYAKYLRVLDTEKEIELNVCGIPMPIVGYVDVVCDDRIIDVKTTGYFKRNVELNPEWKLQANIYQLAEPKPAEFHVLTRAKAEPVAMPDSMAHQLYVGVPQTRETEAFLRNIYDVMQFYWDRFGEDEYPGNRIHPWAKKYCHVENCCQL